MNVFLKYLQDNGTKILGIAQGTVALLCGMADVIPESQMKYWLAASAVLTYWRGNVNTAAIAQAVIDSHLATIASMQNPSPTEIRK